MASCRSSYSLVRSLSNRTGCLLKSSIMSLECYRCYQKLLCYMQNLIRPPLVLSLVPPQLSDSLKRAVLFPNLVLTAAARYLPSVVRRLVNLLLIERRSNQRTKFHQIFYFYYTHMPHIGHQLSRRCYFVP